MIKSNLKGAAGVQINIRDISGRPNTTSAPYRIGLVGWTPKGPSNTPVVVSTESELYSIFGTPKGFKPSEVYLLHNAKILLNAGAEVVIVRTVQATTPETLNYGVYLAPSADDASIVQATVAPTVYLYPDATGTYYQQADGITYSATVHGTTKYKIGTSGSTGAFLAYTLDATLTTAFSTEKVYIVDGEYSIGTPLAISYNMTDVVANKVNQKLVASDHPDSPFTMFLKYPGFNKYFASIQTFEVDNSTDSYEPNHTLNADPSDSTSAAYKSFVESLGAYTAPYQDDTLKIYGDVYVSGEFHTVNGVLEGDLASLTSTTLNENLNNLISWLVIVRLYESKTSQTPLETIFATTNEYVTDYGDQLDIDTVKSNLLVFKKTSESPSMSVVNKSVGRTELAGGSSEAHPVRSSVALSSAWNMFADTTNVEVSLLADGGSSISNFGSDRENIGSENGDMSVVTAILKASSDRMDAPCIIDLPKRSNVKDLITYFKRYPSIGNEVEGSTASYATFWGNAQDGRQIINDVFNKKQIESARSVFKALVAYNVFSTSYPWQTQWGPNRGLITSPSVGTINPRTYPDEVGLLSQNRINPSRLTSTGEYFWDDYTLMAKSSVLQRWHAVCFLANLNKRYRKLLEQYVAELNTPALRKTIWNMLNDDLNFIMNHADPAGLYNYYVICDETNNTPEVIDAGQLNVDVGLEIVRDTRVISLTTTLYRTGGIVESGIKV